MFYFGTSDIILCFCCFLKQINKRSETLLLTFFSVPYLGFNYAQMDNLITNKFNVGSNR